ncbi:hypothetical protein MAM1_0086d04749 [Mucor ambiguus]|uniref:C2H2-type domain-containing protein n=1 Tax=Mucor ambiguus TaxID=91626 RepID=A0A0C9MDA6_9FUNG|nr:hypothetical protein MAM1_0086d04749 [Mucor ambiguus]
MNSRNQPYQPPSPHNTSYGDDAFGSLPSTCSSSSSSSSLATPEPEFDDQKARSNIIQHLASQPPPKEKKQYQCSVCLKKFTRPSALQAHSYTHTAEKPFQCQSPNCGRSFSVVSNLRRHFKVHQKAAVGDKLSAEDRIRCVRNLMERSSRILASKKQILPYSTAASHVHPSYQEHRKTTCPILPLPLQQPQPQHQYHPILPDLHINNEEFMMQGTHQSMLSPSEYPTTATSDSKVPIYWANQFSVPTPYTLTMNDGALYYGSNTRN